MRWLLPEGNSCRAQNRPSPATATVCHGIRPCQDRPHWEVFGGYSFLHADAGPDITIPAFAFGEFPTTPQTISLHQNAQGWQASVEENVNSWFGAVMDFSGDYANRTVDLTPYGIDQKMRTNLGAYRSCLGRSSRFGGLGPASSMRA